MNAIMSLHLPPSIENSYDGQILYVIPKDPPYTHHSWLVTL